MKKIYFLVFVFCFSFLFSFCQTYDWVWARSGQGFGEGWCMTTDNFENVFIAGYHGGPITFGSYTIPGNNHGTYLVKYDANGNVKWAKGNTSHNINYWAEGNGVCTDVWGNCYLTGYFTDTISFDSFSLYSTTGGSLFLVKYDSSGNVLWARSAVGGGNGLGVATDVWGNVYVTGGFGASVSFGSHTISSGGSVDIFLAKYDSSGNALWAKSAGGTGGDEALSVATDSLGNAYVTGEFSSPIIYFGTHTLSYIHNYLTMFLAKYDSSGNVLWARKASATTGNSVATDGSANIYVTGYFGDTCIFGYDTLISPGINEAYLFKYDSSGNSVWAKNVSGPSLGYCVAANRYGKVSVSGRFDLPISILAFDTITLQVPLNSGDAMFVAGYDSSGSILFAKGLASGADDQNAVAVSPLGCTFISGDFEISPFIIGNDALNRSGSESPFVAKLCSSGITANFASSVTNICSEGNNCINFFDQSINNPTSWQWHFTGASPDTSSLQNPTNICYSAAGTYPVTLIVTNATGSDTITISPMITVFAATVPTRYSV